MAARLRSDGNPVAEGGFTLQTPGLDGQVTVRAPGAAGIRGPGGGPDPMAAALNRQGIRRARTIEVTNLATVPLPRAGQRGATARRRVIRLRAPAPRPDLVQVVLARDASGVVTWHFPATGPAPTEADSIRGARTVTYEITPYPAKKTGAAETRGIFGKLGSLALQVLVFPIVEPALGAAGAAFAGWWEGNNRPYRVRWFGPQSATEGKVGRVPLVGDGDWARLTAGRALLLLHGTFSQAHTGFGGFSAPHLEQLHRRYDGRVFAFDHMTMSADPIANVRRFVEMMPDGAGLDLDIIAHSRGGLVARVFAEQQRQLSLGSRSLAVRRVILAGTPNAGTALADTDHLGAMIDTVTTMLSFFPENGVTDVLETAITLVKHIARGVFEGLDGLTTMCPPGSGARSGGTFLQALNQGDKGDARYFALASDYEPAKGSGLATYAKDFLHDLIFHKDNDLVVPTEGVYDRNPSGYFPIEERLVFRGKDAVPHSGFFGSGAAMDRAVAWLAS